MSVRVLLGASSPDADAQHRVVLYDYSLFWDLSIPIAAEYHIFMGSIAHLDLNTTRSVHLLPSSASNGASSQS